MTQRNFVICTTSGGYEASLELRKLYAIFPDADAERHSQVRIVDESGEDYLYPASYFTSVELPSNVVEQLVHAA